MKSLVSFKKAIIAFLFLLTLVLTGVALSSCSASKEDYFENIIKAQNKTESLREFGGTMSASVQPTGGFVSVSVRTDRQYICYGSGDNRRIYSNVDGIKSYCVGNLLLTFSGNRCEGCRTADDTEIYKKPFESEKRSDFNGAEVSLATADGKDVYTVTLTEEIILKQLEEMEAGIPSGVEIKFNDEYKVIYTIDKKTGYLVEYSIPQCVVTYSIGGVDSTLFLKYQFSITTDVNELKIDYPEHFDEYVEFYSAEDCFIGAERPENSQALVNLLADKSEHEKLYVFSENVSASDCDSETGWVAVGFYTSESNTQSHVEVYDKDMKKVSAFSFYGGINSLSIENGRLAVSVSKRMIGKDNNYANSVCVFDLETNTLINKISPDGRASCKVLLYGNALAYYDGTGADIYIYNFSSGQTKKFSGYFGSESIYGIGKSSDGTLSVVCRANVLGDTRNLIFEIDDEGTVANKYKNLPLFGLSFNGTYWYASNSENYKNYVNAKEELTSLGIENFSGGDIPDNPTVIYYDRQYALVIGNDRSIWACDLEKQEYIYCCTNLLDYKYYKAGENCLYCESSGYIYKLDLSSFVGK